VRKLESNSEISIKAYAGTTGILLAFNLMKDNKNKGLLGFAISRKRHGQPEKPNSPLEAMDTDGFKFLNGMLPFPGQAHNAGDPIPTSKSPIQKFRWSDYAVRPETTYTYRVRPVYGKPNQLELHDPLEVTVITGTWDMATVLTKRDQHHVLFNRAAGASQAFSREFVEDNKKINAALEKNKAKPVGKRKVPDPSPEALAWLSRGVKEGIVNFLGQAKDSSFAVDVAIYQYELADIVDAVNQALSRGVKVRLIYHAKPGDKQTAKNKKSATGIPAVDKVGRVTSAIFHHKFIVLSKIAGEERKPSAVLAGSTNFTFNGVYCQANDLYVSTTAGVAQKYLDQFETIFAGETVADTKARDTSENVLDPSSAFQAGFSPRAGKTDLNCFVTLINSARQDVLFATAFNLDKSVMTALQGQPHDSILRYGVQDKAGAMTGTNADRTAEFTAAAMLPEGLEGWLKEQHVKGQTGNILIHTKCIVVDFTSNQPIVISGSHNFSLNASQANDENYEIVRDDTEFADTFGCEIMRIFDQYRYRYVQAKMAKLKHPKPPLLTADDSWTKEYFDPSTLKYADRMIFSGAMANHAASATVHSKPQAESIQRRRAKAKAASSGR
jgi:phosphatidylserine/phosphatidylglycerophosphate/cardiolipin synthase-like enzyme